MQQTKAASAIDTKQHRYIIRLQIQFDDKFCNAAFSVEHNKRHSIVAARYIGILVAVKVASLTLG